MTTMAALTVMMLLQAAPTLGEPAPVSTVTIIGIGEKPGWESGVTKTSVMILGRDDEGVIRPYFMTYFGEHQTLPAMGSRCTFTSHRGRLEFVGGLEIAPLLPGDEFEAFECGPAPSREALIQSEWRRQPD